MLFCALGNVGELQTFIAYESAFVGKILYSCVAAKHDSFATLAVVCIDVENACKVGCKG